MAIPDYQTCMLPLLKFASDEKEHSLREAVDQLAPKFNLTDEEMREMLPSGQQPVFLNRMGWARTYLKQACLIEPTRRGYFRITERGLDVLKKNPEKINVKFLDQFKEFRDFRKRKKKITENGDDNGKETAKTPAEELESAYENLRENLADELIEKLKNCPPSLFEQIIVELLVKMGYGGSRKDAGQAIGRSGDGTILFLRKIILSQDIMVNSCHAINCLLMEKSVKRIRDVMVIKSLQNCFTKYKPGGKII